MNDGTDLDKTNILHLVLGICTELKQNNLYSHKGGRGSMLISS